MNPLLHSQFLALPSFSHPSSPLITTVFQSLPSPQPAPFLLYLFDFPPSSGCSISSPRSTPSFGRTGQQFHQWRHPSGKTQWGKKSQLTRQLNLCIIFRVSNTTAMQVGDGVKWTWGGGTIHKSWCKSDLWAWGVGCCEPGPLLWTRSISSCPFISSTQRHEMESPPPLCRKSLWCLINQQPVDWESTRWGGGLAYLHNYGTFSNCLFSQKQDV